MNIEEICRRSQSVLMPTYKRIPVAFVRGEGSYLYDSEGKKYLDFLSGIAVNGLGHAHPVLTERIKKQVDTIIHTSNLYEIIPQIECAEKIIERSFPGKCFFANSGAEANESALKLSRLYGNKKGKYKIISAYNSFHGRTLATVTLTGQTKYQKGFEPLPGGFVYADYNNLSDFEKKVDGETCAIFLEPILGEGGVVPADKDFLEGIRALCNDKELLLIFDEVQTGCGRTGKWFAHQHYGVKPDVMTLAKSLGCGIPIGVLVVSEKYADIFQPGHHASTFGGNFVATGAASAFIDIVEQENLLQNASLMGGLLQNQLKGLADKYSSIIDSVRGIGLMQGLVMKKYAPETVNESLNNGLVILTAGQNTIRFLPPLNVSEEEINEAMDILSAVLKKFL